jgi:hypothetical protein
LRRHIRNIVTHYGVPVVVALGRPFEIKDEELALIRAVAKEEGAHDCVKFEVSCVDCTVLWTDSVVLCVCEVCGVSCQECSVCGVVQCVGVMCNVCGMSHV